MSSCDSCEGEADLGLILMRETDEVKHYGEYCEDCYEEIDRGIEMACHRVRVSDDNKLETDLADIVERLEKVRHTAGKGMSENLQSGAALMKIRNDLTQLLMEYRDLDSKTTEGDTAD